MTKIDFFSFHEKIKEILKVDKKKYPKRFSMILVKDRSLLNSPKFGGKKSK